MTASGDFSRQSFLGAGSDEALAQTRVAIVGLGGGGSHVAQQLAHLGVGEFRLIDPDAIEESNLNRLVGATSKDVADASPKVDIIKRLIKGIRPGSVVEAVQAKWQQADTYLRDCHVVFGCIDGYRQRDFLETAARRYAIPYIDIGMDVAAFAPSEFAVAGQVIVSLPGAPCMRCLGFLTPQRLKKEEDDYGAAGINPQVVWTNGTLASLAIGEFVKLRTPWYSSALPPYVWLELDGNSQIVTSSRQPDYANVPSVCPHHGQADGLGDPLFAL